MTGSTHPEAAERSAALASNDESGVASARRAEGSVVREASSLLGELIGAVLFRALLFFCFRCFVFGVFVIGYCLMLGY